MLGIQSKASCCLQSITECQQEEKSITASSAATYITIYSLINVNVISPSHIPPVYLPHPPQKSSFIYYMRLCDFSAAMDLSKQSAVQSTVLPYNGKCVYLHTILKQSICKKDDFTYVRFTPIII